MAVSYKNTRFQFRRQISREVSRDSLRKQTAKVRTSGLKKLHYTCTNTTRVRTRVRTMTRYLTFLYFIISPLLKISKSQKNSKSSRFKMFNHNNKSDFYAMNVAELKKIFAGTRSFSKRIFENFAGRNRLCSRKNGFGCGRKLRKRSNQLCREFNNS